MAEERALRKTRVGMVVSNKMDKTVVVAIEDNVKHPIYGKIVKRTLKLHAQDDENTCNVGDKVKLSLEVGAAMGVNDVTSGGFITIFSLNGAKKSGDKIHVRFN